MLHCDNGPNTENYYQETVPIAWLFPYAFALPLSFAMMLHNECIEGRSLQPSTSHIALDSIHCDKQRVIMEKYTISGIMGPNITR